MQFIQLFKSFLALAKLGYDLYLVARRIELLEQLAEQLRADYQVAVVVLSCDLAKPDSVQQVTEFAPEIDLLVSNAGYGYPGDFGSIDLQTDLEILQLNCTTPMMLAHHYLPRMKQAKKGEMLFVFDSRISGRATHGAIFCD